MYGIRLHFSCVLILLGACCISSTTGVKATELKEVNFHENQKYKKWVEDLFLRQYSTSNVQLISAAVQDNVIFGVPDRDVKFGCQFSLSPRTEDPVTLTLKRGARLESASRIASFTLSLSADAARYRKAIVFNHNYIERLIMPGKENMGFVLKKFRESDVGKYWCVVQIGNNFEYGTDATSLTLKSAEWQHQNTNDHQLLMPTGIQGAIAGDTVVLKCGCDKNWCDDVAWFKGPRNEWANAFETIGRKSPDNISPQSTKFVEEVKNRISINEFGLTIRTVNVSDSGRYWCETTWTEPDVPNVRHWETKSIVMIVSQAPKS